jgi:hypothetical protein
VEKGGKLSELNGNRLSLAAPPVVAEKKPASLQGVQTVKSPKIDKGWSQIKDPKLAGALKTKIAGETKGANAKASLPAGVALKSTQPAPQVKAVQPPATTVAQPTATPFKKLPEQAAAAKLQQAAATAKEEQAASAAAAKKEQATATKEEQAAAAAAAKHQQAATAKEQQAAAAAAMAKQQQAATAREQQTAAAAREKLAAETAAKAAAAKAKKPIPTPTPEQ